MAKQRVLNVTYASEQWQARALSNFAPYSFELDGVKVASVEGFIQGIKFPEGDPRREKAFSLHGYAAQKMGEDAERKSVWWNGKRYRYGSSSHHELIARSMRAKFCANPFALSALRESRGWELIHDVGPESPHTSLPAVVFCKILHNLREELFTSGMLRAA